MLTNKTQRYQLIISLLFLAGLGYILSRLRFDIVYQEILGANKAFLTLGVVSLILALLVKIVRFAIVTKHHNYPIPLKEAFLIQSVGISLAIITPARVGEGSKAVLLNKRAGTPITNALSIVIFERFFDVLLLGAGAFIFSFYVLKGTTTLLIGIFLLVLLILFVVFVKYFNAFKRVIPERYRGYFSEVKLENKPFLVLAIISTTGVTWILEAGLLWLLAKSMNVTVPFPLVFGVVCISTIAVVLSILPAGLGTMDLSFLFLFPIIGVARETALSILLIYRFFGVLVPFMFSIIILNYYGLSFRELRHKMEG